MCGKKTTVLLAVIVVALFLGLAIVAYGFISDPFSIPFQDYEQLPKDAQLSYENESQNMKRVQYFGLGVLI